MSPRYPRSPISMKARALEYEQRLVRQVRLVLALALALLGGLVAGAMAAWEWWFPASPEQEIKIYWTHSCKCVFGWINSLEAAGFDVKSYEYETLEFERSSLRMPANLHGCHVGNYLGYFVEGHVTPTALRQLEHERPKGRGVVTQAVLIAEKKSTGSYLDEGSPVLLIDDNGQARPWFAKPE